MYIIRVRLYYDDEVVEQFTVPRDANLSIIKEWYEADDRYVTFQACGPEKEYSDL